MIKTLGAVSINLKFAQIEIVSRKSASSEANKYRKSSTFHKPPPQKTLGGIIGHQKGYILQNCHGNTLLYLQAT